MSLEGPTMDQIKSVMEFVLKEANQAFDGEPGALESPVKLGNLTNIDNQPNPNVADSVVLCLYGIRQEQVRSAYAQTAPTYTKVSNSAGTYAKGVQPLYINLHLMFVANFGNANYGDGLTRLSRLIARFHGNPWFEYGHIPGMPGLVNDATLEFLNLDIKDMHDIMRTMGITYRPAIFYKLRMVLPAVIATTNASPALSATAPG